jgi:hypothetical protein
MTRSRLSRKNFDAGASGKRGEADMFPSYQSGKLFLPTVNCPLAILYASVMFFISKKYE